MQIFETEKANPQIETINENRIAAAHILINQALKDFKNMDENKDGRLALDELKNLSRNENMPNLSIDSGDFLLRHYSNLSDSRRLSAAANPRGYDSADLSYLSRLSKPVLDSRNDLINSEHTSYSLMAVGSLYAGVLGLAPSIMERSVGRGTAISLGLLAAGAGLAYYARSRYLSATNSISRISSDKSLEQAVNKFGL
ncbi:MAG: hypothetical protein K2X27_23810 [Candidatus Obscuribacterales bacterium]|nr:hypothetical protein [Candidatus Obscuribacterales bacterium]